MMVVKAKAGNERGTGWSYTAAAAANVVAELLAGAVTGRDAINAAVQLNPGHNELLRAGVTGGE
jgi:hypothetical protein